MTRRAPLLPLALLVIALLLTAAPANARTGPGSLPPADPAALETGPAPRGTDGLPAATRRDRIRRGLTLPTPRQLFGRHGTRALRMADNALLDPPAAATARARAAQVATPPLQNVGSAGNVKVDSGMSEDIATAEDFSREDVVALDRLRGRGAQQRRSLRFAATAAACPDPQSPVATVGRSKGDLLVVQRILTIERRGRYRLTTEFSMELTGTRKMGGWVNRWAEFAGVMPDGADMFLTQRRTRRLEDTRTGRSWRERPLELKYEVLSINPAAMHGAGNFDDFIRRYADNNDDDPADRVRSDRLLNYDAFFEVAKQFMLAVEARTEAVYRRAEKQWRTPGRCVDLDWDAPTSLVPGQSVRINVRAISKKGHSVEKMASDVHGFQPWRDTSFTMDPFKVVKPDSNASTTFTVTPPSEPWPDHEPRGITVIFYSKAGIAEIARDFTAAKFPIRYRVLNASFDTKVEASDPGPSCAKFGGTSGTKRFIGTPTGQVDEAPTNKLDRLPGSTALLGGVSTMVNAVWTEQRVKGCKYNPNVTGSYEPCEETAPDVHPLPDGRGGVGFTMSTHHAPAGHATLSWSLLHPAVGSQYLCSVFINGKSVPAEELTQTVPLSRLMSNEPQTFTISGSHHADTDLINQPASIDYSWTMSITIQRMG